MIDHYRNLFNKQQWLEDGLCWTVVQPLNEEITVSDLLWRLNGGRDPEERIMEYPVEEAGEHFLPVLFVYEGEGAWGASLSSPTASPRPTTSSTNSAKRHAFG
ncbi:hypothetical protein [Microbispora catharanthi]|uniref:hypothetical protein n=1 Tax=Microbispora catharanthi TaxID=1712871 RepID=UPI001F0DEBF2|nr:hypothetical protein [Microbispora catharanthi]